MPALGSVGCSGFGRLGAVGIASFNPLAALGSDLLAWWDADPKYWGSRGNVVTELDTGVLRVTSWNDIINGNALTQTSGASARPTWSMTAYAGVSPGVDFDGSDDQVAAAATGFGLPSGSASSEYWALINQSADTATAQRCVFNNGSTNGGRMMRRSVGTGVTRAGAAAGNSAGSLLSIVGTSDSTGRHVLRATFASATETISDDGTQENSIAFGPNTLLTDASGPIRIGAQTAVANFWLGQIVCVMVTNPLSVGAATNLQAWFNKRK